MKFKISKNRTTIICIISSLIITFHMLVRSSLLIYFSFIMLLYALVKETSSKRINILLYICSWMYAFKVDLSSYSFFLFLSLVYIMVQFYVIVSKSKSISKITIKLILTYLAIIILSLLSFNIRTIYVIGFSVNIFTFIFAVEFFDKSNISSHFEFFVLGLINASVVGFLGTKVSWIEAYVNSMTNIDTVYSNNVLSSRFNGLDLDPNYFALQVLLGLSICYLLYKSKKKMMYIILFMVLATFGLMTISKMFYLAVIILLFLIFLDLLKNELRRFLPAIIIFFSLFYVFYEKYLFTYIAAIFFRFSSSNGSIVDITTGRAQYWKMYLSELINSAKVLLMGAGIGNWYNGLTPHNMYVLVLYMFGIIGTVLLLFFLMFAYQGMNKHVEKRKLSLSALIPLSMVLIPNIVLDSIQMDYYFLHIFLAFSAFYIKTEDAESVK